MALVLLFLVGCAGGLSNDISVTKLSTDPPSARCSLQGKNYAETVTTPVRLILPKEAAPVSVTCSRAGHKTFRVKLKPLFNAEILTNFLLMSSVGMLIDMINGHDSKYPERVHLNLEPVLFNDARARDLWYDRYRSHVTRKWNRIVSEVSDRCNEASGEQGNCGADVNDVRQRRIRALNLVEQKRKAAKIKFGDIVDEPAPLIEPVEPMPKSGNPP